MKTYTEFLSSVNEKRQTYEYGCAMVYLDAPQLLELHKMIDPADIHENGLETEPHVTLLYGIHSDEIEDSRVMDCCCDVEYSPVRLHNPSLFENDEFDVLKFDAECPTLLIVNSRLAKFPHTNKFPDYHPHATVAYLKPGTGKKYAKALIGQTLTAEPAEIVYSKPDGEKIRSAVKRPENFVRNS